MTRFRWIVSFALLAVLATGTSAFAQGQGRRGGGRPGAESGLGGPGQGMRGFGLGVRNLDLSDAQRQQIRAIATKAREDSRPLADRLRQAADARRKAMAVTPVDENQIRSTTQALASAQADVAVARARLESDIFAVLTPAQQARVNEARERRETRLNQRRGRAQERRDQRQQRRQ